MISIYPDTQQFRHVIKSVKQFAHRRDKQLTVLKFIGTVKIHGANTAIGYQKVSSHWCQ